ncbi:Nup93/Nic96-domain-containing protein [Suillus subalutaceus]|uniref:Nup93/Nic96-domain-containing protein n=1 Tax=Suillus subalutaceus TaxID=48586 RepID=UPI001B886566|nr:Nup93/Nic96-domain-containing protein [Suillus subalutaceus]KAG1838201.1 Nup93/Nic96-domain-containing protein [Suillus subalutaceus]
MAKIILTTTSRLYLLMSKVHQHSTLMHSLSLKAASTMNLNERPFATCEMASFRHIGCKKSARVVKKQQFELFWTFSPTTKLALNSHLSRPDLPSVNLSLDQIEAQSRRLMPRQPGACSDANRANYLLAQVHVDAPALANSIAHLNTSTTFSPLQPLQDADVAGYLRHAHEQNLISTIEEGWRETQEPFYRLLEERSHKGWEAKKRRVSEELRGRATTSMERQRWRSAKLRICSASTGPGLTLQMQSEMMAYDRAISELNAARLRGISCPIIHLLMQAAASLNSEARISHCPSQQMLQNFHVLAKITGEPPALHPVEHAGAHILNAPLFERKYARVYLGDSDSREAAALRTHIDQFWDIIERTIQSRPMEARLGGDPSVANKIRAFLLMRYYKNGQWEDRIELVAGQPLWAKLYYLVRTVHAQEALDEALNISPVYNAHMLHSASAYPLKLVLYKLMGKLEPSRRTVPQVTMMTEDWLWFQLAMVDEEEDGGLRGLTEVLLSYGERHFDGAKKGVLSGVLLMSGQFERSMAALWEHPETDFEAVILLLRLNTTGFYASSLYVCTHKLHQHVTHLTLSPLSSPALSLPMLIWRYVRQFVKMDAKEALQYVYCVCLSADQGGGVGRENVETAWELVRRIIVLTHSGPAWEELVGGFRPDGTRFVCSNSQFTNMAHLSCRAYNEQILVRVARDSEKNDRIPEAIKLYSLAGDSALSFHPAGETEKGKIIERTAVEILRHYERTNRGVGKDRDAAVRLLHIREALDAKNPGRFDVVLEIVESTDLIPLDGDVAKITRKAEEFKDLHDASQRNIQVYLPLTMEALAAVPQSITATAETTRKKSRSLMVFAGILKYRMSPGGYSHLARLDVETAL